MPVTPRGLRATLFVVAASITPFAARADGPKPSDKKICADAYSKAQTLRDAHQLLEAVAELRTCAQPTCKAFIVKDCTGWLVDTESRVPSVVLTAKDARGVALSDVSVTLDGKALKAQLDGQSVDVDPGSHTFTFVASDGTKANQAVTVVEGQKAQAVAVTIPTAASLAAAKAEESAKGASSDTPTFWTTRRSAGVVTGGAGAAGIIVGAIFGGLTASEASKQKTDCASPSSCSSHSQAVSDHSSAVTDGTISVIGFVAGGALVAAGAALFLTGGAKQEPAAATTGLTMTPTLGRTGGGVVIGMGF